MSFGDSDAKVDQISIDRHRLPLLANQREWTLIYHHHCVCERTPLSTLSLITDAPLSANIANAATAANNRVRFVLYFHRTRFHRCGMFNKSRYSALTDGFPVDYLIYSPDPSSTHHFYVHFRFTVNIFPLRRLFLVFPYLYYYRPIVVVKYELRLTGFMNVPTDLNT